MIANTRRHVTDAAELGVEAAVAGVMVAAAAVLPLAGGFAAAWAGRKRNRSLARTPDVHLAPRS
jgi:hypothetical protein